MKCFSGRALLPSIFLLILTTEASATIRHVRQDGSGDFTTIGAAVAASVTGDVIEVGPGDYHEKVDVYWTLSFVSTGGAAATSMDGDGIQYPLWFRGGTGHSVDGFTFRHGYQASGGAAIRCMGGATLSLHNSVFEDNISDYDGGGLFTRDPGAFIDAYDCVFRNNHVAHNGGAGIAILGSRINYTRCTFTGNTADYGSGAVTADRSAMDVVDCLFVHNTSGATVGAIYYHLGSGLVQGNTLFENSGASHASITMQDSPYTEATRNIVVGDPLYAGLEYFYWDGPVDPGVHSCNVFFNNAGGGVVGDALAADEVILDPVFCNAPGGDFTISIQSPAAPANSACGQLIGAFPTNCDIAPPPPPVIEPVILTITDVPNDQGRQVRIRWERADYDAPAQPYVITGYAVYRYQGAFASAAVLPLAPGRGDRSPRIDGWDYIGTVPARGDEVYQYVAPTLCDKPKFGPPCWSVFFVSALTPNPLTYFDSEPDSGWSEDNLPPGKPAALAVNFTPGGAALVWQPSPSADVDGYRVYRVPGSGQPNEETLVQTTSETEWFDPQTVTGTHYMVAAVDESGNESEAIEAQLITGIDGGGTPSRYRLGQNSPNPFNPATLIAFDVPAGGGFVTLEIFDVAGRRVRTLLSESRGAGTWRVEWDGTTDAGSHASSGVYFYRLRAPGFEQTLRMTLVQ